MGKVDAETFVNLYGECGDWMGVVEEAERGWERAAARRGDWGGDVYCWWMRWGGERVGSRPSKTRHEALQNQTGERATATNPLVFFLNLLEL